MAMKSTRYLPAAALLLGLQAGAALALPDVGPVSTEPIEDERERALEPTDTVMASAPPDVHTAREDLEDSERTFDEEVEGALTEDDGQVDEPETPEGTWVPEEPASEPPSPTPSPEPTIILVPVPMPVPAAAAPAPPPPGEPVRRVITLPAPAPAQAPPAPRPTQRATTNANVLEIPAPLRLRLHPDDRESAIVLAARLAQEAIHETAAANAVSEEPTGGAAWLPSAAGVVLATLLFLRRRVVRAFARG